jgi:uncharacterized protein
LAAYLKDARHVLATSRIALVEVQRAVGIANPSREARREAERLLDSCLLVDVNESLLRAAARLASRDVRTLDAVHLASAQRCSADEVLAYDRRLASAATDQGFAVARPR